MERPDISILCWSSDVYYHFYGDLEPIQFDLISAKGVKLCSGKSWIVGRLEFVFVKPVDGRWRCYVEKGPILA